MIRREALRWTPKILLGVLVVWLIASQWLPPAFGEWISAEGGPLENISALFLAAALMISVLTLYRTRSPVWLSVSLLLLWTYMREMDWQRMFTPRSIESSGFYLKPEIPLGMKLVAFAALLPFGLAAIHLILSARKKLRAVKVDGELWFAIGVTVACLALARLAEKIFGDRAQLIEESGETAFAFLLLFLVLYASASPRSSAVAPEN